MIRVSVRGSYTTTAERVVLHKNTIQYRLGKAEEAPGTPIGERRADVELALRACRYLGTRADRAASALGSGKSGRQSFRRDDESGCEARSGGFIVWSHR